MKNKEKSLSLKEGRCNPNGKLCLYAKIIGGGGWGFIACTQKPHKGKWVVEIKNCPKKEGG